MRDLIQQEAEFIFDNLGKARGESERNYWQGRIDQLAWINKQLLKEEVSA